jgi:hypothetical protein
MFSDRFSLSSSLSLTCLLVRTARQTTLSIIPTIPIDSIAGPSTGLLKGTEEDDRGEEEEEEELMSS